MQSFKMKVWIPAIAMLIAAAALGGKDPSLTITKIVLPIPPDAKPFCASLTEDGRLLAFQSDALGGYGRIDIWLSRLENGRWSKPFNPGPGVNSPDQDVDAKLSPDGNSMVFIRSKDFSKSTQIYMAHRENGKWGEAKPIGAPVSPADTVEFGAVLTRDGKRIYFSSNRAGGHGGFDLYFSDRTASGWSDPVNLGPPVNTEGPELDVALGPDGNTLILPGKRGDSDSPDLYISKMTDGAWSAPTNLGPRINTPGVDTCPWLCYDGRTLIINSDWNALLTGKKDSTWLWEIRHSKGF